VAVIYLVDRRNRSNYQDQIDEMYRVRHRIYVDGRGWSGLRRADGRERDEFDTEHAVYLLGLDEEGTVTGGSRLVPTTQPHLMRDVFAHIVTRGEIPHDERIVEWTRYFLTQEPADRTKRRREAGMLLCAMFEYGLLTGLTHISLVCDTFFLPMMEEARWNVMPLGDPTAYREGVCVAVIFEVSRAVLASTRAARGVSGPALFFSPYPPARVTAVLDEAA
jgi:acyl-homoserine lactone synthase